MIPQRAYDRLKRQYVELFAENEKRKAVIRSLEAKIDEQHEEIRDLIVTREKQKQLNSLQESNARMKDAIVVLANIVRNG